MLKCSLTVVVLVCCLSVPARGHNPVTLSIVPIGNPEFAPAASVTLEVFLTVNEALRLEGGQVDLPCEVLSDRGVPLSMSSVSTDPDGDGNPGPSAAGIPFVFGSHGEGIPRANTCSAAVGPSIGLPSAFLPEGSVWYLATYVYKVPTCAEGRFHVDFECTNRPPNERECTSVPQLEDTTRFKEHSPIGTGQGRAIPLELNGVTVARSKGRVCEDGHPCTQDACHINDPTADPVTGCVSQPLGGLFWSDGVVIRHGDLNANQTTPVSTAGKGLALDLVARKLYVADSERNRIYRSDFDGGDLEALVTTGLGTNGPYVLAVDVATDKVYWSDQNRQIYRSDRNGANREVLVAGSSTNYVQAIALDVEQGTMYWTNAGPNAVMRANLDGTGVETLLSTAETPLGIALDPFLGHLYFGMAGADAGLYRADLNGAGVQAVVSGLERPTAIALDLRRHPEGDFEAMYWIDAGTGLLQRAGLDGSFVQTLSKVGIETLPGLALEGGCCQLFGDIYPIGGSGIRDLDDLLCLLAGFLDLDQCPEGDIYPCGGDGIMTVEDILSLLDTYRLEFACPSLCPP